MIKHIRGAAVGPPIWFTKGESNPGLCGRGPPPPRLMTVREAAPDAGAGRRENADLVNRPRLPAFDFRGTAQSY